MAREPRPGQARPGQKRQRGTAISCSSSSRNYDLDYRLYREDVPYRVYEYQRIPSLLNRVPVKIRRTPMGMGVKSSFSSHKASGNSHLVPGQIKLRTEELCSIRGELTQIKAQVDSLLEHLERMDQQGDQPAVQPLPGGGPGIKDNETRDSGAEGSSGTATESHQESRSKEKAEPRTQRALPEEDSLEEGRDMELAVKSHASDWEGSQ